MCFQSADRKYEWNCHWYKYYHFSIFIITCPKVTSIFLLLSLGYPVIGTQVINRKVKFNLTEIGCLLHLFYLFKLTTIRLGPCHVTLQAHYTVQSYAKKLNILTNPIGQTLLGVFSILTPKDLWGSSLIGRLEIWTLSWPHRGYTIVRC